MVQGASNRDACSTCTGPSTVMKNRKKSMAHAFASNNASSTMTEGAGRIGFFQRKELRRMAEALFLRSDRRSKPVQRVFELGKRSRRECHRHIHTRSDGPILE